METVLFICTHNSARSQIAEAFLNALCGDKYEAKRCCFVWNLNILDYGGFLNGAYGKQSHDYVESEKER
jgi:hypothetical protein